MIDIIKSFALNEIGGRVNNQDNIYPSKNTNINSRIYIVCDGVGGSSMGEVASDLICKHVSAFLLKNNSNIDIKESDIVLAYNFAIDEMNKYVNIHHEADSTSTTFTIACVNQNHILVAWCGDSRIMHIRNGEIIYETEDHSFVNQLVKTGKISKEEAQRHPQRNVILRSINKNGKSSDLDFFKIENVKDRDAILLCTDGLLENINQDVIKKHIGDFNSNSDYKTIINQMCQGKTKDNYSMYLFFVSVSKNSIWDKIINFKF